MAKKSYAIFDSLYKKLNPEQKRAVDAIEGPVMVIAGPGTGKTQILTLRIANILKRTDTSADSILALTFTESAAYGMRKRLVDIIGSDAYKVNIYTFHGFANEIITRYPEEFERIIGSRNITEVDQIRILKEILDEGGFKLIKPYGDPYYYLKSGLSAIKELKREDVTPEKFKDLIATQKKNFKNIDDLYHEKGAHKGKMKGKYSLLEKSIEKNEELLNLYKKYQTELAKRKLYDFEDMIMETVRVLESNEELLLELQETYQYVLADEHQDTNSAQNKLVELLGSFHENPNLFVVGDEKQAIFRFQGASLENFLYFKKRYEKAEVVFLSKNYRSGQKILDASGSLINKDEDKEAAKYRIDLEAHSKLPAKIKFYRFTTENIELDFLADEIKRKLESGIEASEIAVLYRDNRESSPIAESLTRKNIPYIIESNQNLLEEETAWKAITLLKAINNLSDDRKLCEALYLDVMGLETFDVHKAIELARKDRIPLFKFINNFEKYRDTFINPVNLINVSRKLESWARISKNKHFLEALSAIISESGMLSNALKEGADKLHKLESFFEEARRASSAKANYKLSDYIDYIELLEEHNIIIKSADNPSLKNGVRLMTAHRSKGLEFKSVFVTGLVDGRWGGRRDVKYFNLPLYKDIEYDNNKDERKLLYVAITRSKNECILTSHAFTREGKNSLPSQFVEEIDKNVLEEEKTSHIEEELGGLVQINENKKMDVPTLEKDYLVGIFEEKGFSVSAINNYIECPSKYFFESLIRIPQSPNRFQHYGNAVHESIHELSNLIDREKKYSKQIFLDIFKRNLLDKALSASDYEELLEKGLNSLSGFYDQNIDNWKSTKAFSEMNIAGVFLKTGSSENKDILLKGRLDRVEILPDGKCIVVDFKTSKPKSKAEIKGETRNSNGGIFRQLVFYKILLRGYEDEKYPMFGGKIVFTEPDPKGKYHSEFFEISDADIEKVESEIKEIAQEIRSLEFINKRCDDDKCTYCKMMDNLSYSAISDSTSDLSSK